MANLDVFIPKMLFPLVLLLLRTSCTIDSLKHTPRPIRLQVIDGDGSPTEVEMHKDGSHFYFVPVSANGTLLPRNPNLEDPGPELARIIEQEYASSAESQWSKDDENLEVKGATETNIDTQKLKSPSSHEQSFNQSSFKQMDPTFRNMKETGNANSPSGLLNNGADFSKASSNEDTDFHLLPESFNALPSSRKVSLNPLENTPKQFPFSEQTGRGGWGMQPTLISNTSEVTSSTVSSMLLPTDSPIPQLTRIKSQKVTGTSSNKSKATENPKTLLPVKNNLNLKNKTRIIQRPISKASGQFSRTISLITPHKRVHIIFISGDGEKIEKLVHRNTKQRMSKKIEKPKTTSKPYPDELIENVTCLSPSSISDRKVTLFSIYHKPSGTCPFNYPCKSYNSCLLWTTGLVGKDLTMNKWIGLSYLQDIFQMLHPKKLSLIKKSFQECVDHYDTTKPLSEVYPKINCESRIQSITECLQVAQSKGLCQFTTNRFRIIDI